MQADGNADSSTSGAGEPEEVQFGRSVARQKNLPLWIAWLLVAVILLAAAGLGLAAGLIQRRAGSDALHGIVWQDKTCTVR